MKTLNVTRNNDVYIVVQFTNTNYRELFDWISATYNVCFDVEFDTNGCEINGTWYAVYGDYLILSTDIEDAGTIRDVRPPEAFAKMYEILEGGEETITFNINELKEYLLNLSREKTEMWCTEQLYSANVFMDFLKHIKYIGSKKFDQFVDDECE